MKNYRHGDLGLVRVKELPEIEMKKQKSKELMVGSNNNAHTFDNGEFYLLENVRTDDNVFGYLIAKNTRLYHKEHGVEVKGKKLLEAKIKDGVYELRRQFEHTHEGMKQVID